MAELKISELPKIYFQQDTEKLWHWHVDMPTQTAIISYGYKTKIEAMDNLNSFIRLANLELNAESPE